MYLQYFGLNEAPFSITPDPAFVYLSAAHRDALAHLLYGVGQGGAGGFVQLTGEVGTGKTTLCRCLLEQVPADAQLALILNPLQTPRELLGSICEELGLDITGLEDSSKQMVDLLNGYLLQQHAAGKRVVVVIDEAQNLSPEALEQVRLLTNLETSKDKLLQMVLLGQPELRQLLQRQNLRQLSQRITARYHLVPLNAKETEAYIRHRIQVAGGQRNPFKKSAARALFQRSGGVPRLINIIADRALAAAYASEKATVNARMIHAAADEVQPSEHRVRSGRMPMVLAVSCSLLLAAISVLAWQQWPELFSSGTAATSPKATQRVQPQNPDPAPAQAPDQGEAQPGPRPQAQSTALGASVNPEPGILSVVTRKWVQEQHQLAWQAMADQWQDPAAAERIQSSCDGNSETGYACLRVQGNWSRIRQLGLPVLLVIQDPEPHFLPFNGFGPKGLLVGEPELAIEVSPDAIDDKWLGEFIVVWPQAPGWPREIRRGESGNAVDIVMRMAAYAEPPWYGSGVFDAQFESWLRQFQQRKGLEPDGIVGPATLIYLMAPTIDTPRLTDASRKGP